MNSNFKIQGSKFKVLTLDLIIFLFFSFSVFSCSIPNLEKPECSESRDFIRQFYSFHFGNDLKPNLENLKMRGKFLSPRLFEQLKNQPETAKDYFTQTDDYPKAFRVGSCTVDSPEKTNFEVLLFWKTETRSEQRTINVETVKENGDWKIDNVKIKQ